MRTRISIAEARRIALAAQGFDRKRPDSAPDARHFRRVIDTLGLLQLDFVNVLVPAHYFVVWSRLGSYDRARFERFVYGKGEYTEQWAHEASIVPANCWSLLEYRRRAHTMGKHNPLRRIRNRNAYLDAVLAQVAEQGALTANELPPLPGPKRKPGDWHRSIPRWALEYHFSRGDLAVSHRLPNFQRVYDLPERLLPEEYLSQSLSKADAQRELLRRAADALGVATLKDLADYYRMTTSDAGPLVNDLVEAAVIRPVKVEGWSEPAYLASSARIPRKIHGASLLSPFDPVVWFRPRAERLFDFHYRIEIYVPAAKRRWGYYVLPFRVGDQIAARVDLKADRKGSRLCVLAVHDETDTDHEICVESLAQELQQLGEWLNLGDISVRRHNAISRRLSASLK